MILPYLVRLADGRAEVFRAGTYDVRQTADDPRCRKRSCGINAARYLAYRPNAGNRCIHAGGWKKYGNAKNYFYKMVERQNYCAGAERFLHTILPFNGMEKK